MEIKYNSKFFVFEQPNSERNPVEEMLAAEASGQFTYVPEEPSEEPEEPMEDAQQEVSPPSSVSVQN